MKNTVLGTVYAACIWAALNNNKRVHERRQDEENIPAVTIRFPLTILSIDNMYKLHASFENRPPHL